MAHHQPADHPQKYHHPAPAAEITRAQSGRKHLAIHARQLALKPRVRIIRSDRRHVLPRLEQTHRPALEDHVHRTA